MTRKEQILQAARDYVSGVTLSSPSDVIHFEYGARWADEHPVNVWHDTNEEPTYNELMLGIDSDIQDNISSDNRDTGIIQNHSCDFPRTTIPCRIDIKTSNRQQHN